MPKTKVHPDVPGPGGRERLTSHSYSELRMSTGLFTADDSESDPDTEDDFYSVHLIDSKPMRRVGETSDYSRSRGCYCTHQVFLDEHGRQWRIEDQQLGQMAESGAAKRVHLRTVKAMAIASAVKKGRYGWPQALALLATMEPSEYRPGTSGDGAPAATEWCVVCGKQIQGTPAWTEDGPAHQGCAGGLTSETEEADPAEVVAHG